MVVALVGVNTVLLVLTNVLVLGFGALLVGWHRGLFSIGAIGLVPARINLNHIAIAAALGIVMLPFRAAIGLMAQLLLEGNLDSLMARGKILSGQTFSVPSALALIVLAGMLVPIAEELLFRAGLFAWLRERLTLWPSIAVNGLVFGAAHFDSLGTAASAIVLGVACAWAYDRYKSIWVPIAIHMTTNTIAMSLVQLSLFVQQMQATGAVQ